MNPGEKQAEIYTYEAPWLIYACNWSVRFYDSFFFMSRSFSLARSLCVYGMRWNSNRGSRSLFSLRNGIPKLYPRDIVYFILYTRRISFSRRVVSTDNNNLLLLSLSLFCATMMMMINA